MFKVNLKNNKKGFSLAELLVVLGIATFLFSITLSFFVGFKNRETLEKDSSLVLEVLRQAKHSTINSKDSNQFGVHFDSNGVVYFVGPVYSALDSTNQIYNFSSDVTVFSTSLNGGGSDILFNKVTGDTNNNGMIILRSQIASTTKSITIYKTGLIE
jgi:prepilin-type N-terminal cleavage/methylation domain-containing protein